MLKQPRYELLRRIPPQQQFEPTLSNITQSSEDLTHNIPEHGFLCDAIKYKPSATCSIMLTNGKQPSNENTPIVGRDPEMKSWWRIDEKWISDDRNWVQWWRGSNKHRKRRIRGGERLTENIQSRWGWGRWFKSAQISGWAILVNSQETFLHRT